MTFAIDPWMLLRRHAALLALVLAGTPLTAYAQAQPPAQNPAAAGLPTREELQNATQPTAAPPPPRVRIHDETERSPCALDDPANNGIRLRVTRATFDGLGPVSAADLVDSYRTYLNSDQPISVVCRIRDAAATQLRALGYIASVEVPVQRIADGQVAFKVLYARVTAVRVIGQVGHSSGLFAAYLQRLVDGREFNRFRAERIVLLARDVPGYDVELTLKPAGTGPGEMIAEVRLATTPVTLDVNISNLASPATGPFGAQIHADLNGLLGIGDQTSLGVYTTLAFHQQQIFQLGEKFLIGASGVQFSAHGTYAVTRPELGISVPVDARTVYANVELSYPLIRRQAMTLRANAGLDLVNQNVLFGGAPLSRDRLRVGYLRFDMDAIDLRGTGADGTIGWRFVGSLELRHGLAILGAEPDCLAEQQRCAAAGFIPPSVGISDPQASMVRGSATGEIHPLRDVLFSATVRGQISSAPVAAFEQFSLGNYTVGRGYYPSAVVGDDGIGFAIEAKSRLLKLFATSEVLAQPYVFTDSGWAWRRLLGPPNPENLTSLGGGLRVNYPGLAALDLAVAVPLSTVPGATRRGNPLVLLTLSTSILPWRNP